MNSQHAVLETQDLTIHFGGHVAVNAVTCRFDSGTLTAIVGPNGAGKTTYFDLISGQLAATSGIIRLFGEDITRLSVPARTDLGIGRAFQLTNLFPRLTVLENIRLAVASREHIGFKMFSLAERYKEIIDKALYWLERVSLADHRKILAGGLAHGDQRKLEVGLLMALEPIIFMFDEPTAGMSVDEVPLILKLIHEIKVQKGKTVLLVEHKLDVVHALADRIIVLHNGQLVADGEPAEVIASPIVQDAYLGKTRKV